MLNTSDRDNNGKRSLSLLYFSCSKDFLRRRLHNRPTVFKMQLVFFDDMFLTPCQPAGMFFLPYAYAETQVFVMKSH